MKSRYRVQPIYGTRWVLERSDGRSVGGEIWRVIDYCENEEIARDRLAVAVGRISREEYARRNLARRKARKQTKAAA